MINLEWSCPSDEWNLVNKTGFCFKLFEKYNMTFIQALSYCPEQQPSSYLAEIATAEEFDYVYSKIKQDVWVLTVFYRDFLNNQFYSVRRGCLPA